MTGSQPRVQIEVEELLLEAAGPYQADLLAKLVEEELARLVGHPEVPAGLMHDRRVGGRLAATPIASALAGEILRRLRAERAL